MKEKPLVENVVLSHTETNRLVYPFIFIEIDTTTWTSKEMLYFFLLQNNFVKWQCNAFAQFYGGSELKKGSSYERL